MKVKLYIFALAASGQGVSGGDRIFIELARNWSRSFPIKIFVWQEGREMCQRMGLKESKNLKIIELKLGVFSKAGFVICYLTRVVIGIIMAFRIKIDNKSIKNLVYSSSEFWMDAIPTAILKFLHPRIFWLAAWYQTAPNPFKGYTSGKRDNSYKFQALLYWLAQLPMRPIIGKFADLILVNNKEERKIFEDKNRQGRVEILLGAVNLEEIQSYQKNHGNQNKIYDAVFQGRFHPQKGVVELIEIWRKVVEAKKNAKLVMIGNGSLMEEVKRKIKDLKLERNIKLAGYIFDGPEKYKLFAQSKIVVHPSFYDSGGMASAEAMAFGLPAVAFDLQSYNSYYPKGVIKVPIGNLDKFAIAILDLIENNDLYNRTSVEALSLILNKWNWKVRSQETLAKILLTT